MNRPVPLAVLVAVTTVALLAATAAAAADLISTTTTITSTSTIGDFQHISGEVTVASGDDPVPDGDHVAVIYYKRGNGAWNLKFVSKPLLTDQQFTMGFGPDRRGTCKVVVRFHGDVTHGPSATRRIIDCATGAEK